MNCTENIKNSNFFILSPFSLYILLIICDNFYNKNNQFSSARPLLGTSTPFWSSEPSEHVTIIKYWNVSEWQSDIKKCFWCLNPEVPYWKGEHKNGTNEAMQLIPRTPQIKDKECYFPLSLPVFSQSPAMEGNSSLLLHPLSNLASCFPDCMFAP